MNGTRTSVTARLAAATMTACLLGTGTTLVTAAAPATAAVTRAETWGDTKKWGDGLTVTVSKPQQFTPSSYSIGHETKNQAVKWHIKVHNGTKEPFQGVLMTVNVKSGADGEKCTQIFDGDKIGGGIEGTVSPGATGTADFGFDVPRDQLKKVDLEVRPGFDLDGKHWVGEVK
ncbi:MULTISPECIES: hypothetical protein [unclassified Streptomyces]|uniref:DUF4352 domain-containing protein n=1 Tax=unclassified Streptomyces TaxID=2593676 RepID=UPI0033D2D381